MSSRDIIYFPFKQMPGAGVTEYVTLLTMKMPVDFNVGEIVDMAPRLNSFPFYVRYFGWKFASTFGEETLRAASS
jgi:hypothetical protein